MEEEASSILELETQNSVDWKGPSKLILPAPWVSWDIFYWGYSDTLQPPLEHFHWWGTHSFCTQKK